MDPLIADSAFEAVIGDSKSMDTRYMWNYNMCKVFKT